MTIRVAINGFGRIGRLLTRAGIDHPDIDIVAINELAPLDRSAYLFKYDSTHGPFAGTVAVVDQQLVVNGETIAMSSERDPKALPWRALKVDVVFECTGKFVTKTDAQSHLDAGAKRVVISAPAKDDTKMVVMGVNEQVVKAEDFIISNASCTTNALAPVIKVLLAEFGIEEGLMTTIHAVTASQGILDMAAKKNPRIGRSGLVNIIPTSTGAAAAVARCIPEIKGKLTGMAFRVPTPDVSVVDLTVRLGRSTSLAEINEKMRIASEGHLKGILGYTEDPLVSTDCLGSVESGIYDATAGIELNDRFFKLIIWYDNEIGYVHRMLDLLKKLKPIWF